MSKASARPTKPKKAKTIRRSMQHGQYQVTCCAEGHIHVDVTEPGFEVQFAFEPDDAYEFAQAILRSYDYAVGV